MEIVYIETSVVSLLVANLSRDLVTAGQQQATRDWWSRRRVLFQCVTSDETLTESARGDAEEAHLRLAALAGMPTLSITLEAENLAAEFLRTGALPVAARSDAVHLAVASIARTDFLLTWNCRHLAFGQRTNPPAFGTGGLPLWMGTADGLHPVGIDGRLCL